MSVFFFLVHQLVMHSTCTPSMLKKGRRGIRGGSDKLGPFRSHNIREKLLICQFCNVLARNG